MWPVRHFLAMSFPKAGTTGVPKIEEGNKPFPNYIAGIEPAAMSMAGVNRGG